MQTLGQRMMQSAQDNTNKLAVEQLQSFGIEDKLKLLTMYRYLTSTIHVHAHEYYELFDVF